MSALDPKRTKAGLKCRSAPCLCVLSFGWQHTRGQQHPIRFRTIQVIPKELPARPWQPERAVKRPRAVAWAIGREKAPAGSPSPSGMPEVCSESLKKIYEMLPVGRSSLEQFASEIYALGARYQR